MKILAHSVLWLALTASAHANVDLRLSQELTHAPAAHAEAKPKHAAKTAKNDQAKPHKKVAQATKHTKNKHAAKLAKAEKAEKARKLAQARKQAKLAKLAAARQAARHVAHAEPVARSLHVAPAPATHVAMAEPRPAVVEHRIATVAGTAAATAPGVALAWNSEAPTPRPAPAERAAIQIARAAEPVAQSPISAEENAPIALNSGSALVYDQASGKTLLAKNAELQTPIASITKLMTAVQIVGAHLDMDELIQITEADRDTLKWSGSRVPIGATYTRGQLLHLALIASDNRAAHALARTSPGGVDRFVANMNRTARLLGMRDTTYAEPTGLSSNNRSTARDLARLVGYAYENFPEIGQITSSGRYSLGTQRVVLKKKHKKAQVYYRDVAFNNTNRLTRSDDWQIGLSKTGFINEAGHCVVMQATIAGRDTVIVLLDAAGNNSRAGDAARIKNWLESGAAHVPPIRSASRT